MSTQEDHLRQNGVLTWFCNEMAIMISHICMKMYGKQIRCPNTLGKYSSYAGTTTNIGLDNSGYQVNSFLISQ